MPVCLMPRLILDLNINGRIGRAPVETPECYCITQPIYFLPLPFAPFPNMLIFPCIIAITFANSVVLGYTIMQNQAFFLSYELLVHVLGSYITKGQSQWITDWFPRFLINANQSTFSHSSSTTHQPKNVGAHLLCLERTAPALFTCQNPLKNVM